MANPSEAVWFIDRQGQRVGPLSAIELAYLVKFQKLDAYDLIWRDGLPDWIEAGSVPGLLPQQSPAPPVFSPPARPSAFAPASAGRSMPSLSELYCSHLASGRYACSPAEVPRQASALPAPEAGESNPFPYARLAEVLERSNVSDDWQPEPRAPDFPLAGGHAQAPDNGHIPASIAPARQYVGAQPYSAPAHPFPVEANTAGTRIPFGADIGRTAADAVVLALDRFNLRTVDDLASDAQLRAAAAYAYDMLPGTVRFLVYQTIGRDVLEGHLAEMLITIRNRIPPDQRARDLRGLVHEMAATPWLSQKLSKAYTTTRDHVGAMVSGYNPVSLLPGSWRGAAVS